MAMNQYSAELEKIEKQLKCKSDIVKLRTHLKKQNGYYIHDLFSDINKWLHVYARTVNMNDTEIYNFIQHVKTIDKLAGCYNILLEGRGVWPQCNDVDGARGTVDSYWNILIDSYCDLNECQCFIKFINDIMI